MMIVSILILTFNQYNSTKIMIIKWCGKKYFLNHGFDLDFDANELWSGIWFLCCSEQSFGDTKTLNGCCVTP